MSDELETVDAARSDKPAGSIIVHDLDEGEVEGEVANSIIVHDADGGAETA